MANFGNQNLANHPDNPPIPMTMPYPAAFALPKLHTSSRHHGQDRNSASSYDSSSSSRRGSADHSGSESSASGHASGSLPCSANNSNVHLPLGNAGVNSLGYDNVSLFFWVFYTFFACLDLQFVEGHIVVFFCLFLLSLRVIVTPHPYLNCRPILV